MGTFYVIPFWFFNAKFDSLSLMAAISHFGDIEGVMNFLLKLHMGGLCYTLLVFQFEV